MPEINWLEQRKQPGPQPLTQTSRNTKNPKRTKHLHPFLNHCLIWIDHSKGYSQNKIPTLTRTHNFSASPWLVHSSPTETSGCASGRWTSGRGRSGRGRSGRGTLARRSQPADSQSSYWCTSTSGVFLAASPSPRVDAAGQGFCGVTGLNNSSQLNRRITAVHGRGWASGV